MIPAPFQNILDRLSVAWHERAIALKAASFALVGVINTAVDFSVFWSTVTYLHWPLVPANVLAWLVAVYVFICDEFLHHLRAGIRSHAHAGATTRLSPHPVSPVWLPVPRRSLRLSYIFPLLPAKLVSILVSFVVNFSLSHFVVFRPRRPGEDAGRRDWPYKLNWFTMQHDD